MSDLIVRLATRASPLARFQANAVGARLVGCGAVDRYELVVVETAGDLRGEVPIAEIGGLGVFTAEVEIAVLEGRADVAVHSAKDLPSSNLSHDLTLASVPFRIDVRDALVGASLSELSRGATVATGSVRRRVQLGALVPGLRFVELRGNIATRLSKVPEGGAAVFANAALIRLGLERFASEVLDTAVLLPQIGQGAIALRCGVADDRSRRALEMIDDPVAHRALLAERSYLARLGGGCDAPVGAYARIDEQSGEITLEAMLATADGSSIYRESRLGTDPVRLGEEVADDLLHQLEAGAINGGWR